MTEQTQESVKVYELAKELGMDSFALLDKLKAIQIEVKSHMSSLGEQEIKAIRDHLKGERKSSAVFIFTLFILNEPNPPCSLFIFLGEYRTN